MDQEAIEAVKKFIQKTAEMPEYERGQVYAQGLHHARLGLWSKFPEPMAEWFRQMVSYIDDNGPVPDYWPERMPWWETPGAPGPN